jgi:hypothetical protein
MCLLDGLKYDGGEYMEFFEENKKGERRVSWRVSREKER